MERIHVGGLEFSRIGYGTMRLHDLSDDAGGIRLRLEAALDAGMSTLDTADIYGGYTVEGRLGEVFKADPTFARRFEIVTKCGIQSPWGERDALAVKHYDTTRDYIHAQVERSLLKLGVEAIDLLLIHRPDPLMDADATGRALDELVAAGKARAVGVSNFRPWDVSLLQSRMGQPLVANQIEMSLGHTAPFTDGDLAFAYEHDIRLMAWSPLGGGRGLDHPELVAMAARKGCTPGQLALAFLLRHPAGIQPVIGTNRPERIAEAAGALELEMSRVEWFQLLEAARGQAVA